MYKKISFIGAGNMSNAIIRGLIAQGYPADHIVASNPSQPKLDALKKDLNIKTTNSNVEAIDMTDVVVLSVKPQVLHDVCKAFIPKVSLNKKCVVSLAAGIETERLQHFLGGHEQVIRVMPNTPCAIGYGMSGIFAPRKVQKEYVDFVENMMQKVGETAVVNQEADINTVIAAAGSSPAYFFLIAESMITSACKMGIPETQARQLVQQAMLGSAQMLKQTPTTRPEELRRQVTSKGGTTYEAIKCLQAHSIESTFDHAMNAAVVRAKQMAQEF